MLHSALMRPSHAMCAEHIKVACQIMTSCVLLGGRDFLREYGQGLASALAGLTGTVNERGTLLLLPVEELLLQVRRVYEFWSLSPSSCSPQVSHRCYAFKCSDASVQLARLTLSACASTTCAKTLPHSQT